MTRIRLVISDVDGTILTDDKQLPVANKKAAQRLHAAGIHFTVTSSRPAYGMRFLAEPLAITLPMGPFNGSSTVDTNMKPIEEHVIPKSAVERGIDLLAHRGIDVWLFTNQQWMTKSRDGEYIPLEIHTIKTDPTIVTDFTPYLSHACKVVGSSKDFDLLAQCEGEMQKLLGGDAIAARSQKYYLDITPPGQDKGAFVRATAKRLGIPLEAVATIGDGHNDAAMFDVSGLSIAMGNAADEVKQRAKRVTASNEEDGFAKAMDVILRENGD